MHTTFRCHFKWKPFGESHQAEFSIDSFVICLFLLYHRQVTILKELDLLITVYSLSTTYQEETKEKLQFSKRYSE